MKTPFSAIPVIAFLNDMGTKQKLSFEPLPDAKEHIALIHASAAEEIMLLRKENAAYKAELLKLYAAAKTRPQSDERRKNADRYLWIRNNCDRERCPDEDWEPRIIPTLVVPDFFLTKGWPENIDASIDQQIKTHSKDDGEL